MDQVNEDKNLGVTDRDRETEQGVWQYVETAYGAEVKAGDFAIRLHWKGPIEAEKIRAVARLIAAAPALYEALRNIAERLGRRECERYSTGIGSCFAQGRRVDAIFAAEKCCAPCTANAALALVDKPASQTDSE